MYQDILIATDGSEFSEKAIAAGVALAKAHNGKVTAVHVTAPFHVSALEPITAAPIAQEQHMQRCRTLASSHLQAVANASERAGVACETVHAVGEHPYREIIEAARSKHCDLIVMASHGRRGISAIVLGSETLKVLTHSTIPVLVLR